MTNDGRALKREFITLLRKHRVIVPQTQFQRWLVDTGRGKMHRRTLKLLFSGEPRSLAEIRRVVEYCLDPQAPCGDRGLTAVEEFAGSKYDHAQRLVDALVEVVSIPGTKRSVNEPATLEALLESAARVLSEIGPQGLSSLVSPAVSKPVLPVRTVGVPGLTDWIYTEHGRQHSRKRESEVAAKAIARKQIGVDLAKYTERALGWSATERWTVALVRVDGKEIGGGIALPVTEACFERVVAGKINTWEITAAEVRSPSRFLVAEAFTMRPSRGTASARVPSPELCLGFLAQCAVLSAVSGAGDEVPLRIVSADFSGRARHDLDRLRFEDSPATLPGTTQRVRTRTIDISREGSYQLFGFWRTLQRHMGRASHERQSTGSAERSSLQPDVESPPRLARPRRAHRGRRADPL